MKKKENNFAFIDGANLHKGVVELGWRMDYKKFLVWLREKYDVTTAYIFLGFVGNNSDLYRDLQNWGYVVVLKPTLPNQDGEVKGNCDAEMVLQAVSDMYRSRYERAVVVTGDGDFACLVRFLKEQDRFKALISPSHKKASALLRRTVSGDIVFLERFRNRFEYQKERARDRKRKSPAAERNPHGDFFW